MVSEHISTLQPTLWKGYQLIGFDGSTLLLPPSPSIKGETKARGTKENGAQTFLAQALFGYDLLSNFMLGAEIDDISVGEKTLFKRILPGLTVSTKSIIVLDRGFGNYSILQSIKEGTNYCIRLSTCLSNFDEKILISTTGRKPTAI